MDWLTACCATVLVVLAKNIRLLLKICGTIDLHQIIEILKHVDQEKTESKNIWQELTT